MSSSDQIDDGLWWALVCSIQLLRVREMVKEDCRHKKAQKKNFKSSNSKRSFLFSSCFVFTVRHILTLLTSLHILFNVSNLY